MFDRFRTAWDRLREGLRDPFDVPDWPDTGDEPAGFWGATDRAEGEVRRG